jgi:hypothetical protein
MLQQENKKGPICWWVSCRTGLSVKKEKRITYSRNWKRLHNDREKRKKFPQVRTKNLIKYCNGSGFISFQKKKL